MPINAVTADFNHDGIADLAVIDSSPAPSCNYQFGGVGSIAILLGNGDGTFSKHSALCFVDRLGETPHRLAVTGDLNRDGNVDLLITVFYLGPAEEIDAYYGHGDGTFTAPQLQDGFVAGREDLVKGIALGDFYSDGQLNIAVSRIDDFGPALVYLLPGFDSLLRNPVGGGDGPLAIGDFNRDGLLDLADNRGGFFLTGSGLIFSSGGSIFHNRGNGVFAMELSATPFEGPIVSGDFNGDGILDLATVNGSSISVLLGNGDGTFSEKTGQPVSVETNSSLITADINGDGILDLATIDSTNVVSIWLGNGDGTFRAPVDTTGRGDSVAAADFNGDGRMDLVVTNSADATVSILLQGLPYKALVESPINADGLSAFKAKRGNLPVKFSLTENGVFTCALPPASIAITRTAGGTAGPVDKSVYATPADKGSNFRIDPSACQYVYNVAARSLGVGSYRVDISIDGIAVGHAVFSLR